MLCSVNQFDLKKLFLNVLHASGSAQDVYWYSYSLFLTGQFHRAAHQLKANKLDKVKNYLLIYQHSFNKNN